MMLNRKAVLKHILYPLIVGTIIALILEVFFTKKPFLSAMSVSKNIIYSIILTIFFWKGNEFIIRYLMKKHSWSEHTKKIMWRHFAFTLIYSLVVIFLFYLFVWFALMHKKRFDGFFFHFRGGFFLCFILASLGVSISYTYNFFKYWKKTVLESEQLKRESLTLQYESLKNQVNPHFLFNSLNILTSLIETNKESSVKYVKQLSQVFRYVLDQNARELVPFSEELEFIESYNYLHKIRFGNHYEVTVNVNNKDFYIVPMTLQILLENAVKHNEISLDFPLRISIVDDDKYLVVSNTIKTRNYLPDSNQVGLKTLNFQYEFFCGEKPTVTHTENEFTVKVPKIKSK